MGHKLYNVNRLYYEGMDAGRNYFTSTMNAWTPQNAGTSMPRAVLGDLNENTRESDRFLENGNFVRLRQLQLDTACPELWLRKCILKNAASMSVERISLPSPNIPVSTLNSLQAFWTPV